MNFLAKRIESKSKTTLSLSLSSFLGANEQNKKEKEELLAFCVVEACKLIFGNTTLMGKRTKDPII